MVKVSIALKKIEMKKFDAKTFLAILTATYQKNQEVGTFEIKYPLEEKADEITASIMNHLKGLAKKSDVEEDDVLGDYRVIDFLNEERTHELVGSFFVRLHEKGRIMKRKKEYTTYMTNFHEVNMAKLELTR